MIILVENLNNTEKKDIIWNTFRDLICYLLINELFMFVVCFRLLFVFVFSLLFGFLFFLFFALFCFSCLFMILLNNVCDERPISNQLCSF